MSAICKKKYFVNFLSKSNLFGKDPIYARDGVCVCVCVCVCERERESARERVEQHLKP